MDIHTAPCSLIALKSTSIYCQHHVSIVLSRHGERENSSCSGDGITMNRAGMKLTSRIHYPCLIIPQTKETDVGKYVDIFCIKFPNTKFVIGIFIRYLTCFKIGTSVAVD